jgi:predicted HD superfamily hydrolase involved in NAD metabolism
MNRVAYLQATRQQLPLSRWEHTLRVVETADEIASQYQVDRDLVDQAAILHDYCKFWTAEELIFSIKRYKLPRNLLLYNQELWHGPVAAVIATKQLGVTNGEVLHAIRYHTTGRPEMGSVEKVVFLADYIEPARQFPGVDAIRLLAKKNMDQAIILALKQTIQFLTTRGQKVYPLTICTLEHYLSKSRV